MDGFLSPMWNDNVRRGSTQRRHEPTKEECRGERAQELHNDETRSVHWANSCKRVRKGPRERHRWICKGR